MKKSLLVAVKLAISSLLLWLALRQIEPAAVWARLKQADPLLLGFCLLPTTAVVLLGAWRWQVLSRGLLRFGSALRYTWIGLFYGALLPGGISGDVAKGAALALKDNSTRTVMLPLSIIADRLAGVFTLLLLLGLAGLRLLTFDRGEASALQALGLFCVSASIGACLLVAWLIRPQSRRQAQTLTSWLLPVRVKEVACRLIEISDSYASEPSLWRRGLWLSFAGHTVNLAYYALLLSALGLDMRLDAVVVLYAVLSVLVMIPISVSGLGIREWFTLLYFPAFGFSADSGIAFSWAALSLHWFVASIGGLLQVFELFRPVAKPLVQP